MRAFLIFGLLMAVAASAHQLPCQSLLAANQDPALEADERGLVEGVLNLALMVLPPEDPRPYNGPRQLLFNNAYFKRLALRLDEGTGLLHRSEMTAYQEMKGMGAALVMGVSMVTRRARLGAHLRGLEIAVQILERKQIYGRRLAIYKLFVALGHLIREHWEYAEADGDHLPPPMWPQSEELAEAMRIVESIRALTYAR